MILGIDPGPVQSAYVFWDNNEMKVKYAAKVDNILIYKAMENYFRDGYKKVAIEMIASYGMPVGAEVFETCTVIGKFEMYAEHIGLRPTRVFRKDCKMNLCGTCKAKDANIRQSLIDRYGVQGTMKNPGPLYGVTVDKLAALAVAVTFADNLKLLNEPRF